MLMSREQVLTCQCPGRRTLLRLYCLALSMFQLENRVGSLCRLVLPPLELRGERGHFSGSRAQLRGIRKLAHPPPLPGGLSIQANQALEMSALLRGSAGQEPGLCWWQAEGGPSVNSCASPSRNFPSTWFNLTSHHGGFCFVLASFLGWGLGRHTYLLLGVESNPVFPSLH